MNMNALERFLEDFKYNIDFKLCLKLLIALRNYKLVDMKKESYLLLRKLKSELRENDDYKTYRKTVGNLEHALLVETELVSCKAIQKELENCSKDLFWFPIDRKEWQAEIDKYTDTSKIRRLIKKFKNMRSIAKFIDIPNLTNIILSAIPTPRNVGIDSDSWNSDSLECFIKRYFNLKPNKNSFLQQNSIEKGLLDYHGIYYNNYASILNFYASQYHSIENANKKQEAKKSKEKTRFSFYYLYMKEIVFEEKNKSVRVERRYDTLFVMHIIDFNSNIRKGKPEFVSYNKDKETIDLHGLFECASNYAKSLNDDENSTIPVFLFHTDSIENIMDSYYQYINRIPYYRLIPFNNHKEMNECQKQLSSSHIDSLDLIVNTLPNIIKIESKIDVELEKLSFHTYTKESKKDILEKISNLLDSILTPPTLPSK